MRNLLLLLILANILYFVWGFLTEEPPETGIAIVDESKLGPPLEVSAMAVDGSATSVGAVLGSGKASDLAAVVGRSCVTIGPFKTNAEADGAFAEYDGQGMRASVRTTQGQVFVGHWVQVRKIPDKETGNGMLRTLRTGGLGDAYLVEDEEGGFKISLGLFGEMTGAERIELEAKSMGLPADITPRMREATVFFVDLGLPPGQGASEIVEKYGESNVLLRDKAVCPRTE
jgi:hypothetical protein